MDPTPSTPLGDSLIAQAETHLRAGRLAEAHRLCTQILEQQPNHAMALHYLGVIAFHSGRPQEAIQLLHRAAELQPGMAVLWFALAQALSETGQYAQAMTVVQRAVALNPSDVDYRYMLGTLAGQLGYIDQALENLHKAIEFKRDLAVAHNNLGQVYCLARRIGRAMEHFARAATLDPAGGTGATNLVYYSHFDPSRDGLAIRRLAEDWARRWADPITATTPPASERSVDLNPDRPLRIGFVSPDLYEHPVGRFLLAILGNYDRSSFNFYCYSGTIGPDVITAKLQSLCTGWCETGSMSDDQLAHRIRTDRIDILIDLSLHMAQHRLPTFARKPAPVQLTYLGYAGTSGMKAMDWRLSDAYLDPEGNDRFYTERTFRLPRSYWCYTPPPHQLPITPRQQGTPITFACLNHPMKMSDASLQAWAELLRRVPNSRMLIHAQPGQYLRDSIEFFRSAGVDPARVEFIGKLPFLPYLQLYQRIDVALDSFPYAGGTTTCDALWMGVPVITLAGEIAVHRGGVSLLSNLGLNEFIAQSVEQYVSAARQLASSPEKLAELRATLRGRMQSSILMNASEFTRDFESALRQIWRDHVLSHA